MGSQVGNMTMSFEKKFSLVEASKEVSIRCEDAVIISWTEIDIFEFIEYGKYCKNHSLSYKPTLAVVEELK